MFWKSKTTNKRTTILAYVKEAHPYVLWTQEEWRTFKEAIKNLPSDFPNTHTFTSWIDGLLPESHKKVRQEQRRLEEFHHATWEVDNLARSMAMAKADLDRLTAEHEAAREKQRILKQNGRGVTDY